MGHPDDAGTQPKSVRNAKACANSHNIGFSSFFGPSVVGQTSIFASQRSVLLTWDEERTDCQQAAKKWRRDTIFAPQIVSKDHPDALVERKIGLCGRSRALEAPSESLRNFFVGASEARGARKSAC